MRLIKKFPFIKLNIGAASKARDIYIWYDFYYGQGMTIYDKLKQPAMVFTALSAIVYFQWIPSWILALFVPLWFIGWLLVGLIIFKVFKIPQRTAVISGKKISPWEKEKMKVIKECLKILKQKES